MLGLTIELSVGIAGGRHHLTQFIVRSERQTSARIPIVIRHFEKAKCWDGAPQIRLAYLRLCEKETRVASLELINPKDDTVA